MRSRVIIASHVAQAERLPVLVADVLPAGDLLEDQQADLVAAIQKVRRLRVMRGAHDVAAQFVLEDVGVLALQPCRGRRADVGIGLVAVEADQLDAPAVEVEAVVL